MASTQSEKDEETRAEEAEERADAESSEQEAAESAEASGTPDDSDDAPSDGGADESSDDDRDSEEGSSDASAAAPSAVAGAAGASPKTGKPKGAKARSKDGMTAGARLAAAKAAKAARKAAKRGKEKKEQDPVAQMRESELAKKAQEAGSWAAENRSIVLAAAVLLVVAVGAWIGWTQYSQSQAQAAGALLRDAIEIAQAEIVPEAEGDDAAESDAPTFPTEQARAEAALEAYRRVLTEYGGSDAAVWARLGEADALATLDRHEEAREAYEAAEREGGSEPGVLLRAMEGRAFTFEAEQQWDQALEIYQQLATADNQRYEAVAQYHIARMHIAKGDRDRATQTLRELVEELNSAEDDESKQDFAYVLAQAETRLYELDPSSAPTRRSGASPLGGGLGGAGDVTNEQLQELIRQFQLKQQQEQQQGGGAE